MSKKSTKLKVEGLPRDATVSQISVLFSNKRKLGGGPIENIELTKGTAIVTFEHSNAVDIILGRGNTVQFYDVTVKVTRYFDPDDVKPDMKQIRTASKGNINSDEQELSDCEDMHEKIKKKSKKPLKETEKKKKTAIVKKQSSVSGKEAKTHRKKSKTYSETSDDEDIGSSEEKSESESLPRKSKTQKSVKEKITNESCSPPKTFSAKENKDHKMKVSKHAASHDELSDSESQSEKLKNKRHKSLNEISTTKKSSVNRKKTSDSDRDSECYRKRSKANSRTVEDNVDESTETESSLERPAKKTHAVHKKLSKKKRTAEKARSESENSEEDHTEESEELWKTTIKAKVSDITKTKDFYVMYLEDPHISQGQFYEESFLLDGLNRNLYVTFHDRKAAVATASFKHKADSNLLKVEMATKEDFDTHLNLVSVHGYFCNTDEQRRELKKKIEEISQMEVIDIIQQEEPRSAIIVFNPDSCEDISALTWMPVLFGNTRLIVAPVFKTNCVKVTGLHTLSSDETVKRYMSNSKRSGGGTITFFQRLSETEAYATYKERESVDGIIAKGSHTLEGGTLKVSPYHPCLSTEVYKKLVEPLKLQLGSNTGAPAKSPSESSRQMHSRGDIKANRSLHTSQTRLEFKKVSLYTYIDKTSNKKNQYALKLLKCGYEFLKKQEGVLINIMQSVHCRHTLVDDDSISSLFLTLNWPHKIKFVEVRRMLDRGLEELIKYLDTFTVAQFELPQFYKFQQYYLMTYQDEVLGFDIYFDSLDNLAYVVTSTEKEHFIENRMNALYQKFTTSALFPTASDHNRSYMNNQSGESRPRQNEKTSENIRPGIVRQEPMQNVCSSKDLNQTNKKKPAVPPKPLKENNKTKGTVQNEVMLAQLPVEQKLELGENDLIMLERTHFHKDLEAKIVPLQIILNTEQRCAIIKSSEKSKTNEAQVELLMKVRDFKSTDITSLFSPEQLQFLDKQEVQNKINDTYKEMKYHAHVRCSNGKVSVYHMKDVDSKLWKDVVTSQVMSKKKELNKDMVLILQSEKGRKFLADVCEISDGMKVRSCVKLDNNFLHIVTPAQQLDIVLKSVDKFLEENKSFERSVLFSGGKKKYVQKCLSQDFAQISNSLIPLGAKIVERADNYIVQGLKDGVIEGEKRLSQLSDKILVQEVSLKYFGVQEFLQTAEGESLLTRVENAQSCVILPSTDLPSGQSNFTAFGGQKLPQSQKPPSLIALDKLGDCSIMFQQGDITSIDTEAIVNPLDSTLKFSSGLAKALILKGGHKIQSELASSQPHGVSGEIIVTSAGNLDKCKTIIHVVCPVFSSTEMDELERAVAACLQCASSKGLKSIALPALGTGKILKFDTFVACQRLIKALHQHLMSGDSTLKNIHLCDTQADHVKQLIDRYKNAFSREVDSVGSLQETDRNLAAARPIPQPRTFPPQASRGQRDFRHIKVTCILGEIAKQKTDVIVVTVGNNPDLSKSGMTKDIVKHGGDIVQQEFNSNYGNGIKPGDFGQTSGGNLPCKRIFYARLHHWRGDSEEHMSKLVYKLLQNADQQGSDSMSIPAIGTGNLGYPADTAADVITNAICQFAMDNPNSSLKLINLVVFPKASDVVQAFQAALSGGRPRDTEAGASGYARSGHKEHRTGELQMKSVTLKIKKGDITSEKCDAIICGIRETMDLSSSGAVSKNLLKKCGSALQDECNSKKDEMAQKGYITTSAPNLNCKNIYHVSMDKFSHNWDKCVSQVLADAESQGCTSVGIPALGAGSRRADHKNIKQSILKGVHYFASKDKVTLKDVRLVVFSQEMLDDFLDDSDSPRQSSHGHEDDRGSNTATAVSEHVSLKIYADSHKTIANANKALNDVVKAAFKIEKDKKNQLKIFTKHQVRQLEEEGRRNQVKVNVSIEESLVTMSSFNKDGIITVQKLLNSQLIASVEDHHKSLHQAVKSAVIWQFEQEKWRDFEPVLNSELESAYKKKSLHYDITDARGRNYRIDFSAMKEFPLQNGTPHGQGFNVRRYDRTKEGEPLPKQWERMKSDENLKLVVLQAGSPEFQTVEKRFIQGGAANIPIKKIERIQNKSLYQQFKAKKREMDHRNPKGHNNEQRLFHGTDVGSVTAINENGFNRSYCGKN
ncbi:unnamed protein product, partial [Candidula unifasciata]